MKIKISADSTLDLPREFLEKYDIGVVPMNVVCDGKEYKDGVDITAQDLFDCVEAGGESHTAAINASEYTEFFDAWLREYDAVVHITLSRELSADFQDATLAGEGKPVYVVDSRNLSSSGGMLAIRGAELAAAGETPEKIAETLSALAYKIATSFVIDTLKYLRRGGRCSALAALGANVLKLKPCIEVHTDTGKMDVGKKYRGNFETVLMQYVEDRLRGRADEIDTSAIYLTHAAGVSDEVLDKVRAKVAEYVKFDAVYAPVAGCTISNHCGPVCLGLLFFEK
ncbi:MAG: DegV family protein [Oscillospiraceae bacterium]|nr:DegV family protein [Oscillospiraceae bacterium]